MESREAKGTEFKNVKYRRGDSCPEKELRRPTEESLHCKSLVFGKIRK
jgi:hypothetical protein